MKNPQVRLFLLSFLVLFLELALIRYIPSNIRLISFFSNLILLGTFLGLGGGLLLSKMPRRFITFFPYVLLILVVSVAAFQTELNLQSAEAIFFSQIQDTDSSIDPRIVIPLIFVFTTFTFLPFGQEIGKIFIKMSSLRAYCYDILGSLCGIIFFTLLSSSGFPPMVWFSVVGLIFFALFFNLNKKRRFIIELVVFGSIIFSSYFLNKDSLWSPYYKIDVFHFQNEEGTEFVHDIYINNTSHQFISTFDDRDYFYYSHYKAFPNAQFKKILVIGSGNGADVATALAMSDGVEIIDAVDIDPKIVELGKQLNPDQPYQDKRVRVHIDDGRNFLQNSTEKYDLIIYALPDSLISAAYADNIRLESFLFTQESFSLAKEHLTDDGLFVLYNYYRHEWLIARIVHMLDQVFDQPSKVISFTYPGKPATIFNGPKASDLNMTSYASEHTDDNTRTQVTDDWPFLYLKERGIPSLYTTFLTVILVFSLLFIYGISKTIPQFHIQYNFFFLGAAFMLLETKSLVTFSLLFGNTWLVNSLVISGILSVILFANFLSMKMSIKKLEYIYFLLFLSLILQYFTPSSIFTQLPFIVRFIASSLFYFSPLFFANLIFSQKFKNLSNSDVALGSNILGAVVGGVLEYLSLYFGFKFLLLIIGTLYFLSLFNKNMFIGRKVHLTG